MHVETAALAAGQVLVAGEVALGLAGGVAASLWRRPALVAQAPLG
jgi:hypothetical protein